MSDKNKPLTKEEILAMVADGTITRRESEEIQGMTSQEAARHFARKIRRMEDERYGG